MKRFASSNPNLQIRNVLLGVVVFEKRKMNRKEVGVGPSIKVSHICQGVAKS